MGVTNSSAKTAVSFNKLLAAIRKDYPAIAFEEADEFRWSAEHQTVYFAPDAESPAWSLLHELGHMLRQHKGYSSDRTLVRMEMEAWQTAQDIAHRYSLAIDEDHIQDCIDSYRSWQHERSACPVCRQTGLETSSGQYRCINCGDTWQVTTNRFCRVYRKRN